jgi:dissimilatory sulfite reductase (desulfoviridin) alpha/beta subunit
MKDIEIKAKKYDQIIEIIDKYYETYDENDNEIPPEKDGDVGDIGLDILNFLKYI